MIYNLDSDEILNGLKCRKLKVLILNNDCEYILRVGVLFLVFFDLGVGVFLEGMVGVINWLFLLGFFM